MVADGPGGRPAAHRRAGQDQRPLFHRRLAHAVGDEHGRRGEDESEGVLDLPVGVEEQDVLRARPDVDAQGAHGVRTSGQVDERTPSGEAGLELMPVPDALLPRAPAQADLPAIDEGGEVDQPGLDVA